MPNWVSNTITIYGDKEGLEQIHTRLTADSEFQKREREHYESEGDTPRAFSFSNLVCPPKEIWDEYFTTASFPMPENNWYNWNNYNWNTKWDACEAEVELNPTNLTIRFETAWDKTGDELLDALVALVREHGGKSIGYWYEEEQGWGGEMWWDADLNTDHFRHTDNWDIPQSHEDYEMRDKECMCVLYPDDPLMSFPDCPKEEE